MNIKTYTKELINQELNTFTDAELNIFNFIYNEMKFLTNDTYHYRYQDIIDIKDMIRKDYTFYMIIRLLYKNYIS